ncbi:MAG: hypothetical protein FJW14_01730 [Acidimicrobiia bacterium]|nr:hypothetical protein [Acidimicrobiia bacterium]
MIDVRPALCALAALLWLGGTAAPADAQIPALAPVAQVRPVTQVAATTQTDLHGTVLDDRGAPLTGAVISALGSATAFAVSDRQGQFTFRNLPAGPYLIRAHLQGYVPARARIVQVTQATRTLAAIALTRRADGSDAAPQVLEAGVGATGGDDDPAAEGTDDTSTHDHGEVAWRLRHLKRGVLKEVAPGVLDTGDDSFFDGSIATFTRTVGTPARYATALFTDLPLSGQFNLLTRTSFDRPQDMFHPETWVPGGIAFVALHAPAGSGDWRVRGAVTQGDLSSWIVEGSYLRGAAAEHRYEAGVSYGMQRYLGGNADALAAVTDGARNVGAVYAYDDWTINPRVSVAYGAKYARYDYLAQQGLLSPRASVTVAPLEDDPVKIRASVSRRQMAPGAEEFIPPSTGLWLPPERTFSPLTRGGGFTAESISHVEVAAERETVADVVIGGRLFRQSVRDQLVTLFGVSPAGSAPAPIGHYYVASAGDVDASGWGVSLSRAVSEAVRASIDYTRVDTTWARATFRSDERIHDVTASVESVVPVTETRVFVLYKLNTGFADAVPAAQPRTRARFDVQVNQSLPFMNFSSAQWEMLVAVRNLFREELLDASVYDEVLVVRPPKRIVGGVTVRF